MFTSLQIFLYLSTPLFTPSPERWNARLLISEITITANKYVRLGNFRLTF